MARKPRPAEREASTGGLPLIYGKPVVDAAKAKAKWLPPVFGGAKERAKGTRKAK